jgi:peptide/nickel transport system permease protein
VLKYLLKRLVMLIGIGIVVSFGAFMLIRLLPGDLATAILGFGATPERRAELYARLGLDKPLLEQYFIWMSHVVRGDFGVSPVTNTSITSTVSSALLVDIEMVLMAQIFALSAAVPLALAVAKKPFKRLDRFTSSFSFVLLSIPGFVIITLATVFITVDLHRLFVEWGWTAPASFIGRTWASAPTRRSPSRRGTTSNRSLLPSFVLALGSFVVYFRVLRGDLISSLQEEFITMARSKGLTQRRIMWRHAFRVSSVALIGTIAVNIGVLVAGGFVAEFLLGIPGTGFITVQAINNSDYLLLQALVLVLALMIIVVQFIADFIMTLIDPRIARD